MPAHERMLSAGAAIQRLAERDIEIAPEVAGNRRFGHRHLAGVIDPFFRCHARNYFAALSHIKHASNCFVIRTINRLNT